MKLRWSVKRGGIIVKRIQRALAHINNNNNSYIALYPVKSYKLAALYIINIKIRLTTNNNKNKEVQVL